MSERSLEAEPGGSVAEAARLTWSIDVEGDAWLIVASGELDEHGAKLLTAVVQSELRAFQPRHVIVDLEAITFIDSSGLRGLLAVLATVQSQRASYAIRHPSAVVCRLLDLNDLQEILHGS